jgi:hypothetical protein
MKGPLNIDKSSGITILNQFSVMSASLLGSMLYSESPNFSMNLKNSIVECRTAYVSGLVTSSLTNEKSYAGGAIYIKDSILGLTSNLIHYRYCYETHAGAIVFLQNSKMLDTNSKFYQNQALQGGVIKCITCHLDFTKSEFYEN